jgi:penicillin amidase/acyl-homoserine-lactone acylase
MKLKRVAVVLLALLASGFGWRALRKRLRPAPPAIDAATVEHRARVKIMRDRFGVPHIFGKSDVDTAFGLAWAHAEDDFPMIQGVIAASRGKLATLLLSKQAILNDYYARLVGVEEAVAAEWERLSPEVRALLDAYGRGLTHWAREHPDEADTRLLPFVGRDVAAGFAHKIPIMVDVPGVLRALDGKPRNVGEKLALADGEARAFPASNSHAVAAWRSSDGVTRLNVNSHQPWEGPVTWYEAHLVSEEGWNMTGGTFPGAPFILHGHNQHLGWAHTVNLPDLVDVYRLEMNPAQPDEYRFEGKWKKLDISNADIEIDTGLFNLTVRREVYRSVHGPVFKTSGGVYAIRYAGAERRVQAAEQWFRMNKARDFAEWKQAMSLAAIPMFNTVYADKENIFYLYNASLPQRGGEADYRAVLPGDRADLIWQDYLPHSDLPQVSNPPSGFVQNCNGTPFRTTTGEASPRAENFPANAGIETAVNNRTLRSLELFGGTEKISGEDFLRFKFDRKYAAKSTLFEMAIAPILAHFTPANDDESKALALLRAWDGIADENSAAATLAILTWQPMTREPKVSDPIASLREAIQFLKKHHGGVEVPLGRVQRLRRGAVDLPLGGGPDVLNAANTNVVDGHLIGFQGDSYILIVEFRPDGPVGKSIHQYGNCNRPKSPHYADQAPLFVERKLKPAWRKESEIRANLEREYSP